MSLRVLLLAPHPFYMERGTPMAELALVEHLCSAGHRVDVLTYHEGGDPDVSGCRVHRIPNLPGVTDIPPGFSWKKIVCDAFLFGNAIRHVQEGAYDLVHAVEESAFMARLLKAWFQIPYVYDMDSRLSEQLRADLQLPAPIARITEAAEGWAVRGADGVLAVTASLAAAAREYGTEGPVAIVEDTTLLEASPESLPPPPEFPDLDGPILMYVGNLAPYQGIDLLLEAFDRLAREETRAHLVVVGGGEQLDRLRGRVSDLPSRKRVHFLGSRPLDQLGQHLGVADILVSPRLHGTNTPMKIYSYLDAGRPLVATRIPAHTQVLDESVAVLVEPEVESLAMGLASLLAAPGKQREIAERARERARAEYTPQVQRGKVLAFYRSLEERLF